jgi:hypothetical protein
MPDQKRVISSIVSQHRDPTIGRHELCRSDSQKGGLARTVAAEEGENLAATNC